jgi:hypothetical protein
VDASEEHLVFFALLDLTISTDPDFLMDRVDRFVIILV